MKTVVITGSTEGIGFGLARECLKRGLNVVISSRTQRKVEAAMEQLSAQFPRERITATTCDVTSLESLEALWMTAVKQFGQIDYWINNAGRSHPSEPVWQLDPRAIESVVDTNLIGVIYGTRVAYQHMLRQGFGAIYNMEGLGSSGPTAPGTSIYAATKSAVTKFTQTAIRDASTGPILIGYLSPGMVLTDLLTGDMQKEPDKFERNKRLYNILADKVETVTPFLVDGFLKNTKHGARIAWLTTGKTFWRFLTAPLNHRDLFSES